MPLDALAILTREEIFDLLAYLAPGATHMMIEASSSFANAVRDLSRQHPDSAAGVLHELLDSPYPFAHFLALNELSRGGAGGGHGEMDRVLIERLDAYATSADTVGFYWACEALASRGVVAAIPALARYTETQDHAKLHGPIGMGYGYPAAKALARLVANVSHPQIERLLSSENIWVHSGTLAGLCETNGMRVSSLLRHTLEQYPSALLRAEAMIGTHTFRAVQRP